MDGSVVRLTAFVAAVPVPIAVPDAAPVPRAFLPVGDVLLLPLLLVLVAVLFLVLVELEFFELEVAPDFFVVEVPWVFFLCLEPVLPELWELLGAGAGVPQAAKTPLSDNSASAMVRDCFTINEDSLP